jgi:hypothetical protein
MEYCTYTFRHKSEKMFLCNGVLQIMYLIQLENSQYVNPLKPSGNYM